MAFGCKMPFPIGILDRGIGVYRPGIIGHPPLYGVAIRGIDELACGIDAEATGPGVRGGPVSFGQDEEPVALDRKIGLVTRYLEASLGEIVGHRAQLDTQADLYGVGATERTGGRRRAPYCLAQQVLEVDLAGLESNRVHVRNVVAYYIHQQHVVFQAGYTGEH